MKIFGYRLTFPLSSHIIYSIRTDEISFKLEIQLLSFFFLYCKGKSNATTIGLLAKINRITL